MIEHHHRPSLLENPSLSGMDGKNGYLTQGVLRKGEYSGSERHSTPLDGTFSALRCLGAYG